MSEISDKQMAHDLLHMCLHGPVPMKTTARMAEAVLRLEARVAELEAAYAKLENLPWKRQATRADQLDKRVAGLEVENRRLRAELVRWEDGDNG